MITNISHVMTLANSIIGVSVLAMPFCFKQCGIILSILVLLMSSALSKFACHLLVKSAVMSRRRNFEFLAFHAFGRTGKFLAELFIIGYLMGTCIAFFVVVGDLGPEIVGKMIDKSPGDIRTSLLVTIAVFVILPLGLLRNVDSLSTICTATIGFYLCLVLKVMTESMTHIFATDWYDKVFYWRPSGILQCIPIFSMALFCQTQLFEIYENIPNVCLEKMNNVVDTALNICTVVYVCVGFFGYVAFCTLPFTGNILMSFEPSLSSEAIKIGFVLSVAFSFPLVIFPCRASLNSLLFRWAHSHETSSNYIPETRFRWLTFLIVTVSLITGILIPNIEFVLGLVGSTIGVMICLMFPAAFFISISSKNTNERLIAQAMLFVGVWIMILGTYANLYAMEESANAKLTVTTGASLSQLNNIPIQLINEGDVQVVPPIPKINDIPNIDEIKFKPPEIEKSHENINVKEDVRQEPPIPVERAVVTERAKKVDSQIPILQTDIKEVVEDTEKVKDDKAGGDKQEKGVVKKEEAELEGEVVVQKARDKIEETEISENKNAKIIQKTEILINSDAIKKEESELVAEAGDALAVEAEHDKKQEELKKTLEQHKIEQRQMLQEQKEIINTLEQREQELEREKKEKEASKKADLDNADGVAAHPVKTDLIKNKENHLNDLETQDKSFQPVKTKSKDRETEILLDADKNRTMKKSRGPILSVLAKTPNSSNDIPANSNRNDLNQRNSNLEANARTEFKAVDSNPSNNNVQTLNDGNPPVPIALAMSEKTKKNSEAPILNKKDDETVAIRREILENQQRFKRSIDERLVNDDLKGDNVESFVKNVAQTDVDKECMKTEQSLKNIDNVNKKRRKETEGRKTISAEEKVTTELLLIKTNSYLSDQGFENVNSLDKSIDLKRNFEKSNPRDLKPVSSKNGNRK